MSDPTDPIARALNELGAGRSLSGEHIEAAFDALMTGATSATHAAALLMGLRVKGETGEELAGAVRALRSVMRRVALPDTTALIDTCGTGGGDVPTFNISTAAALVAVGAGARVAKHGNRSYTSRCGSADVLEALGIPISIDEAGAARLIARAGMTFLYAPAFHPAMKHVAPVRRDLGVTTVMNLAGPLANPAGVRRQVVGVADADRAPVVADALAHLAPEHALVVHAEVGMDEVSPGGLTRVWEVRGGTVEPWTIRPAQYGLDAEPLTDLEGGDPPENAGRIMRLLDTPDDDPVGRAAVILNGGAAVYVAGLTNTIEEGFRRAADALTGGAAARALALLRRESALSTS